MLGTVSDGGTELKAVIVPSGNGTVTFCGDIGGSVVGGLPLHLRQFSADPFNVDVAGARVYLTRDISLVPSPGIEVIDEAGVQFVQRTLQAWAREATEVAPPPADLGTPPDPLSIARPALRPGANSPMPAAARYSVQVQTAFGAVDVLALCVRADGSADGDDGVALWTKPQCACGAVRIDPATRTLDICVYDLPAEFGRVSVGAQSNVPGVIDSGLRLR